MTISKNLLTKALVLLFGIMLAMILLPQTAFAAEYTKTIEGVVYTYGNTGDEASVTGYVANDLPANVIIPNTITVDNNNYIVTSIGNNAFPGCESLISVTIPNGVTSIGENAFRNCGNLKSITIPDSVTLIVYGAFFGCNNLTGLTLAVQEDYELTILYPWGEDIGKPITGVILNPGYVFINNATEAVTVTTTLNGDVIVAAGSSYAYTSDSTTVDGVVYNVLKGPSTDKDTANVSSHIDDLMPAEVAILGKVKIAGTEYNLTAFVAYAFKDCAKLKSISIPSGTSVTVISNLVFQNCTNLTSVTLPLNAFDSMNNAFEGCTNINEVILEVSKVTLEFISASSCELKNLKLCHSLPEITKVLLQPDCVLKNGTETQLDVKTTLNGEVILPIGSSYAYTEDSTTINGVVYKRENDNAYVSGCNNDVIPAEVDILSKVIITNDEYTVTKVGNNAFQSCSNLESITIPSSVTEIGANAFQSCTNLESITIPSSVTEIGANAFRSCSNLKSITIPSSVTEIGANAFDRCRSLESITIPAGVTKIGTYAFANCIELESITIPLSVTEIGANAFYKCTKLTELTLDVTADYEYKDATPWENVSLPIKVINLNPGYVFTNGTTASITVKTTINGETDTFDLPLGVTYSYTENSVTINGIVYSIKYDSAEPPAPESAYVSGYTTIPAASITLDQSIRFAGKNLNVTEIGAGAFQDCKGLVRLTIPATVTKISDRAFANSGLCKETVEYIGGKDSIKSFGKDVFAKTTSMVQFSPIKATRTSATEAKLVFTADNEGKFYYAVAGDTVPADPDDIAKDFIHIATKGENNTFTILTDVGKETYKIYIWRLNAAGNAYSVEPIIVDIEYALNPRWSDDTIGIAEWDNAYVYKGEYSLQLYINGVKAGAPIPVFTPNLTYDFSDKVTDTNNDYTFGITAKLTDNKLADEVISHVLGGPTMAISFNDTDKKITYEDDLSVTVTASQPKWATSQPTGKIELYNVSKNNEKIDEVKLDMVNGTMTVTMEIPYDSYVKGANTIKAVYVPADNSEYRTANISDVVTVNPKPVVFTDFSEREILFDAKEHTVTFSTNTKLSSEDFIVLIYPAISPLETVEFTSKAASTSVSQLGLYVYHIDFAGEQTLYEIKDKYVIVADAEESLKDIIGVYGNVGAILIYTEQTLPQLPPYYVIENLRKNAAANKDKEDEESDETDILDEMEIDEPQLPQPEIENPFIDVSEGDWFYDDVMYVYEQNLMLGINEINFAPESSTTRAMLAQILYRLEGSPAATENSPFEDVTDEEWYHDAIVWAAGIGIVNGISETEFAPDQPITREQLVVMLNRYTSYMGYTYYDEEDYTDPLSGYTDADEISDYAYDSVKWAAQLGLMTGRTSDTIAPQGTATRAEIAAILHRFMEKLPK